MKRRLLKLMLGLLVIQSLTVGVAVAQPRPTVDVAFVHDRAVSSWAQGFHDSLRHEVRRILDVDYTVRTPAELVFTGDGTAASVRAALERALGASGVELVIASGPLGSREAGLLPARARPVIGTMILDPGYQGVPMVDGTSGVDNYTYVTTGNILAADLEALDRVLDYRRLVILGSGSFVEALPAGAELPAEYAGHDLTAVVADGTVDGTLAQVPADADAVYLLPMIEMTRDEIVALLDGLAARGLPVLSLMGEPDVRDGALVGVAPADWPRRLHRRVALVASRIMAGEPAAELPVSMTRDGRLFLNLATATRIGVSPPFEVIIEAVTIDEPLPPGAETVDLAEVMVRAQAQNRDIAATESAVAAGEEQVGIAKAELLPQIGIGLDGFLIDKDTAAFFPTTLRAHLLRQRRPDPDHLVGSRLGRLLHREAPAGRPRGRTGPGAPGRGARGRHRLHHRAARPDQAPDPAPEPRFQPHQPGTGRGAGRRRRRQPRGTLPLAKPDRG